VLREKGFAFSRGSFFLQNQRFWSFGTILGQSSEVG
jgi:hypothetical protein